MSLRPTRKVHRNVDAISINITPVMNLFVVLIPFLLTSAAFLQLAMVDTTLPRLAEVSDVEKEKDPNKLIVTVRILSSGFDVNRVNPDSRPAMQARWNSGGDLSGKILLTSEKKYDFNALGNQMVRIKAAYPTSESVLILPEENINYETIIHTMDATRERFVHENGHGKKEVLFPDAIIGHLASKGN